MSDRRLLADGVIVPLLQSVVTGGLAGAALTSAAVVFAWPAPLAIGGLGASLSTLAGWLLYRSEWAARVDPRPQPQPAQVSQSVTARVELAQATDTNYLAVSWFDIPLPLERVIGAAVELAAGRCEFSMSSLAGAGKPLSRSEFTTLRDVFIAHGCAQWTNKRAHAQGCYLNGAGRSLVRKLAIMGGWRAPISPTSRPDLLKA